MFNFFKKTNLDTLAQSVIRAVGGSENIKLVENCSTRLRLAVKNLDLVNKDILLSAGAKDVLISGEDYVQVVVGTVAPKLADLVKSLL